MPRALLPALLVAGVLLQGCAPPEGDSPAQDESVPPDTLVWDGGVIRSPEGEVLLTSEDFPGSVEVAPDASFGAGTRITAARASPDGARVAVTTTGAAHGYGWILARGGGELRLVAFQYGGTVRLGEWGPTGRYLAFIVEPPGPGTHIWIADAEASGEHLVERGFAVEDPARETDPEGGRLPAGIEWIEHELCFVFTGPGSGEAHGAAGGTDEVPGDRYCVDPETREVRPQPGSPGG